MNNLVLKFQLLKLTDVKYSENLVNVDQFRIPNFSLAHDHHSTSLIEKESLLKNLFNNFINFSPYPNGPCPLECLRCFRREKLPFLGPAVIL